jgi:hypothetical protein
MEMKTLFLLLLVCAPQLKPRPVEWWDTQIEVGLVVRGNGWGEMRLVEMKRSEWYPEKTLCKFVPCEPDGHDWDWNCYKDDVAIWLRCDHITIVRKEKK